MSKNENTTSSSDEEFASEAFREACDETFLPQSLFSSDNTMINGSSETEPKGKIKPSLRITERLDDFKTFGVSQSFKDYVAKKLDALLEKNIVDHVASNSDEDIPKKRKKRKRLKNVNGIKLMNSSEDIITRIEEPVDEKSRQTIKPWKFTRVNESENITKCKEVAVDSEWITSKTETKAWSERCKGTIFKYKKGSNGTLIEHQ